MAAAVAELLRAYNAHDVDAAVSLYRPDGEHREIAQDGVRRGSDDLRASLESFLQAFPDATWTTQGVAAGDPLSAAPYRLTGTLASRLGPFDARGQALDIQGVMVAAVADDGLIRWTADYWDAGTFFKQMG